MKRHGNKKYYPLTALGVLSAEILAAPFVAAFALGDANPREWSGLALLLAVSAAALHVLMARLGMKALLVGSITGMVAGALASWGALQRSSDHVLLLLSVTVAFYWALGIVLGAVSQVLLGMRTTLFGSR